MLIRQMKDLLMTNIFKSGWLKRAGSAVVALPTASLPVAAQSKFLSLTIAMLMLAVPAPSQAIVTVSALAGDDPH